MFTRGLGLTFAAASLLFTIACGANVPAKPEASSLVAKAIESKLTRTLPAATYCMTANPDFSFANMGQVDLVATFENLIDKTALYEGVRAEAVRIAIKEFPYDPAVRPTHPSCEAMHEQSKQRGLLRGQIRLAVVQSTLTDKATTAGVHLGTKIEVATRELVDVTEVVPERGGAVVKYKWKWTPTAMAATIGYTPDEPKEATARLKHSNNGWAVEDTGIKR